MALVTQNILEDAKKKKATTTTTTNKMTPGISGLKQTKAAPAKSTGVTPKVNTTVTKSIEKSVSAKPTSAKQTKHVNNSSSAVTNVLNKVKESQGKPIPSTGLTPNKGKTEILKNLRPQEETSQELKSVVEQLNKNYKINPYSAVFDPNTQALEKRRQELINEERLQSEKKDLVTIPEYQKAYEEALAKGDKEEANRINEIIDALDDTSFERLTKSAKAGGKNAFATVANLPNIVADISYEKDALGYEEQYKRALAEGNTEEAEYYKQRAEESRQRAEGFDALGDSNAVSQWANDIRNESQKIMELERIGASGTDMVMMDVADTVANMTPSIVANMVLPGTGLVVLGGQVFSSTYAQRIEEGYDMQTAANNALATASIEVASEMLGAVIGKAATHIPGFSKLMDTAPAKVYVAISSKLSQFTPSYIQDMHSEGLEEVFSDIVQPWADYFTLPDKKEIEYKPGDIFRDYIMSYPTTLALGAFGVPGRVIKTSKQMYTAQHDLNVLNESEARYGSLGTEFSGKMELAKRNLLSAINDFKKNSVVASAIKVQSDMVEDITLDDYLNLYDEALKPTTDKVGSAINQEINKSMQNALRLEAEYLAKNKINASPGVWAGVSEDIKNEVRELADKGTKLDFNKYITETDSKVRQAMVEIAEKNIKGENGENFDAKEYMELTPEQKANAEQIGKIAKTIKGDVRAAKLRKGVNGFRDSDTRSTVVSVDQTTTIDANKLMGMEDFNAPLRENFKTEAEFLKAKNEFLENLSREAGAQESAMTTVGHEVGHSVEETSVSEETENALKYLNGEYTDPYRDLKKAVTEYLGGEENFKKMADRIGAIYKLQNVDKFNAENEAVAFTVQKFADDPEFFARVAKYNDSVAYSMYRDFMATLTGDKKMQVENAYARGVAQANRLAAENTGELGLQYAVQFDKDDTPIYDRADLVKDLSKYDKSWSFRKKLEAYLNEKYANRDVPLISIGNLYDAAFTKDTSGEMTHPAKTLETDAWNAKTTTFTDLDPLLSRATIKDLNTDKKNNGKIFDHFVVNFGIKNGNTIDYWEFTVNCKVFSDGFVRLYDISSGEYKKSGNALSQGTSLAESALSNPTLSNGNGNVNQHSIGLESAEAQDTIENKIYNSMSMSEARRMLEKTWNQYKDDYDEKTLDEFLKNDPDFAAEQMELLIENTFNLQDDYVNSNEDILNGEYSISDIVKAYLDGKLKNENKSFKLKDIEFANGAKQEDTFFTPKDISNPKDLLEIANQRMTKSNEADVLRARADLITYAHNPNALNELGMTNAELNKKIRSWSRYSAQARATSEALNRNVPEQYRWSGLENSNNLNKYLLSNDANKETMLKTLVKSISGKFDSWSANDLVNTMLSIDSHINYKDLSIVFDGNDPSLFTKGKRSANGTYNSRETRIAIGRSGLGTLSHETGHFIDNLWGREFSNLTGRSLNMYLSEISTERLKTGNASADAFIDNFKNFIDKLSAKSDIRSDYTQRRTEVFARFVDHFTAWVNKTAGGYGDQSSWYKDNFNTQDCYDFVKLLQQKSMLNATVLNESQSKQFSVGVTPQMETDSKGRKLSNQQREFFKESKVTDDNGNLLEMYHGTPYSDITAFKKGKAGYLGPGIYLTSDKAIAKRYASQMGDDGNIHSLYANVTNPFVVTTDNPAKEILGDRVYNNRANKQGSMYSLITNADINKLKRMGYDGIVWKYAGSVEVNAFASEQIKRVDNLNPTSNKDIRYSMGIDNSGYHYGDENIDYNRKSEKLWQRGGRGTGAFGTGMYFFGEQNSEPWFAKGKTEHKVDFSDYNLFKVKNRQDGFNLHDYFNKLDDLYRQTGTRKEHLNTKRYKAEIDYIIKSIENMADDPLLFELDDEFLNMYRNDLAKIEDKEFADNVIREAKGWANEDGSVDAEYLIESIRDAVKEYTNGKRNAEDWDDLDALAPKAAKVLGIDEQTLKDLSDKAMTEAKADSKKSDFYKGNYDSVGTRVMKALGYEGIDVRGIKGLDDSKYGSVIYDLKPETVQYSMGLKPEQTVRLKSGKIPAKVGKIIQKTYDAFDEGYSNDMEQFGVAYEDVADEFLEAANEVATNGEISKETMDRLRDILYYGVENVYEPGERGKDVYEQIKDILKKHPLSNSAIGQKYVDYGADGKKHMTRLHKGMTQGTLNDMKRNGIRFKNGGYDLGELENVFKEAGLGQYFDERTFSDLEDFNKTLSDLQLTLQNQTHKSYDMAEFADETEESFNQFFDETMKQFVEDVSGKQMSDQAAEVIDSLDVSDEEFNKFVKRDPISPRALENITKHKKELVDTAPEWIPNYDIIREKHPEFTDLEMNDALFEILQEGTISESTAWRIKEDMLRRNSVQTNNEADQSIKELVDDSLDYFAADAAYKMNKKAMNSVANKANTIIRSFTGQNVTEGALDSYEQMEGLEKTLKQVEKRRAEVSAKNETMVKELLAAGADYGSSWMTLEQNLDKIAGTDSNLRQTLRDYFELPKYESQIKYVQFLQKYGDTLQGLVKDGIRAGTKESAAVQYMLEGHREDGSKYTQKDLMEQFPKTWEKLDRAAKTLRNMYDEMYNLIETNRENTYGDIDAKYDLQLAKAREKANTARRTADQIKQKLSEKADARLEAMFNRADAQASKLERQYEQMLEDKATRDGTRRQKLQYRKNYAHHLTDQGGFFKQMKNALSDGSSVPTKLSGISNRAKPLSGFASFFQRQNAQTGYVADAIGGMAEYIKDASKIYAYDPYIEYLRFAASDIRAEASGNEMSRFVSWVDNYANGIAGKTQMLDRGVRETFGEKPLKVIKTLNNQARKNAIVGNLSTALVQFANLPNAIGVLSQYGGSESALDIARGLSAYASTLGREGAESVSPFMSARYYDINTQKGNVAQRSLNGIAKTLLEFGDHEAAKMIWNCSYQQALRLNVDDPIMYADDLTRRSIAGRSVSELPLAMESQVLKLLMPFQVETNNTFHLMTGLMRDKKLGSLLAMLIGGWLMNGLYEAIIGRRPITDPIDAIIDGAQSDNPADIATRLGGELLSAIPGSSYAVSLFGLSDIQRKKLFGENDPSRYGTGNIGLSTLGSATMDIYNAFDKKDPRYAMNAVSDLASTYLAPGGGRQIQRTVEGLQSEGMIPQYVNGEWVNEPRYYTPSGKVGFVNDPNDVFDVITAGTFGRWATKEGKAYLENGGKYLSDQATRQLEALGGDSEAYNAVIAMRDMQGIPGVDNSKALQKRKYLEDQGLWDTFAENMEGNWGDYGLNKTVGDASEEEFNKLYSEVFGNEDLRLDVASAAGMKETLDTNKEEKESKTDANLDFLAGTPFEKAAIQNLDMDDDVLQTVTDLGYDYKTIKQIDDYIDNTESLKDANGKTVRNSKALQMRQQYEELGVYDDIFSYISENGLDPQDYGLNKTVMGYSDSKFESQYNKVYGGGSSSSKSSSSSGSSRKSSKRKSSKKKGFSSEEEMKAFFDQLVANIGLSSSKSSSTINSILKKSKNLRNTKFSKRSS